MPIEVREIIITAQVKDPSEDCGDTDKSSENQVDPQSSQKDFIDQVFQIFKRTKER